MEGSEALVKLAAGRLSLHSSWNPVLTRIKAAELRDPGRNDTHELPEVAMKIDASETAAERERDESENHEMPAKQRRTRVGHERNRGDTACYASGTRPSQDQNETGT